MPYRCDIVFNKKRFTVFIKINSIGSTNDEYHYDLELRTKEKISGNEFQKLKHYLEQEGYIDAAVEHTTNNPSGLC
jgi:hypothetical protein